MPHRPASRSAAARLLAILAALLGVALTLPPAAAVAAPAPVTITVGPGVRDIGPDQPAQPIAGTLLGANGRWIRSGLGTWDAADDEPSSAAVTAAADANLQLLRYPGGTVANMFDFTKAIGANRGCQIGAGSISAATSVTTRSTMAWSTALLPGRWW